MYGRAVVVTIWPSALNVRVPNQKLTYILLVVFQFSVFQKRYVDFYRWVNWECELPRRALMSTPAPTALAPKRIF